VEVVLKIDKSAYMFWGDGSIHKVNFTEIALNSEIMADLVKNARFIVKNAFKVRDYSISLSIKSSHIMMTCELKKVQLNTTFSLQENKLVPEFQPNTQFLRLNAAWPVPTNMKLYFSVMTNHSSRDRNIQRAYLFATNPNNPGFWALPLPNYYEDGRMCLGRHINDLFFSTTYEVMDKALDAMENAVWNIDLANEHIFANSKKLFKFNPENQLAIAVPLSPDWTTYCKRINQTYMEDAYAAYVP
jgi:hypothetical protein